MHGAWGTSDEARGQSHIALATMVVEPHGKSPGSKQCVGASLRGAFRDLDLRLCRWEGTGSRFTGFPILAPNSIRRRMRGFQSSDGGQGAFCSLIFNFLKYVY